MKEINLEIEDMEEFPEDAKFVITPEYYLYMTISEYGIDPGEWIPKIWTHIFEDFMEGLEKMGYVEKNQMKRSDDLLVYSAVNVICMIFLVTLPTSISRTLTFISATT